MNAKFYFLLFHIFFLVSNVQAQLWEKYFDHKIISMIPSMEGGYVILTEASLIKMDMNSDTVWTNKQVYYSKSIVQLPDSSYLILDGNTGIDLIIINKHGKRTWSKKYYTTIINGNTGGYYATSLQPAVDGGFMLLGENVRNINNVNQEFDLIIKLNTKFEIEWERKDFSPGSYLSYYNFCPAKDGYIFAAHDSITKIDLQGKMVWKKDYKNWTWLIHPSNDGGFVITSDGYFTNFDQEGNIKSKIYSGNYFESWAPAEDGYYYGGCKDSVYFIIKVDNMHQVTWSYHATTGQYGNGEIISSILPLSSSEVLVGGRIYRKEGYGLLAHYNINTAGLEDKENSILPTIFPNPNMGNFQVTFQHNGEHVVELYNSQGTLIRKDFIIGNNYQISNQNLPSGLYLLYSIKDQNKIATKVVVAR